MTYLEQRSHDLAARLHCYASGDGALSFVWQRGNIATGDFVTMRDAMAFILSDSWEWRGRGEWRLLDRFGQPKAYQPVTRVGPDAVEFDGRVFRYVRTSEQHFTVWTEDDGKEVEVRNISMKGRIMFFVNNEELIGSQV